MIVRRSHHFTLPPVDGTPGYDKKTRDGYITPLNHKVLVSLKLLYFNGLAVGTADGSRVGGSGYTPGFGTF